MAGIQQHLHLVAVERGIKVSRCDENIIFHLIGDHECVSEFGKVDCTGYIAADGLKYIFAVPTLIGSAVLLHPEKGFRERPLFLLFCYF